MQLRFRSNVLGHLFSLRYEVRTKRRCKYAIIHVKIPERCPIFGCDWKPTSPTIAWIKCGSFVRYFKEIQFWWSRVFGPGVQETKRSRKRSRKSKGKKEEDKIQTTEPGQNCETARMKKQLDQKGTVGTKIDVLERLGEKRRLEKTGVVYWTNAKESGSWLGRVNDSPAIG